MKKTMRAALVLSGLLAASGVGAHDGHGMPTAVHWHATDVMGLAIAIGFVAAVLKRDSSALTM
jgi:hypothetical protein